MFNTGNSEFINEFSSLFFISEIANYLCVVGILIILTRFKLVEEKYFIFWCLYFLTPFFGNYVLFDPLYMPDQYIYTNTVNEIRADGLPEIGLSNYDAVRNSVTNLSSIFFSFVPLFSLIILVLGTILAGLATPAEAAAVGAFGALVLSYFYKSLKWKNFKESVFLTAKTSAMIMWLFVGSWTFASVFSYLGGHEVFEHFFKSMDIKPWQFLVITQIIIFLLGWPLEWTEILIIFVPIFLPLVEFFGVNPYFFAMLIALNLQTSFLTPPMAMSAYYLKGVQSRNVQLMEIFRGIMPFLGIVILAMVLMYIFPGIALWLPDTLFAE